MNQLEKLLSDTYGRKVSREEIAMALGVSIATYARRKAKRFTSDELIRVAQHFGMSPTMLLVDCGALTPEDAARAGQEFGMSGLTDVEILNELMGRAQERESLTGVVATHRTDLAARLDPAMKIARTGERTGEEQPEIPAEEFAWMDRTANGAAESSNHSSSVTPRSTRKSPTGQ